MKKKIKYLTCFSIISLMALFFVSSAYANIVFPAVAHQFAISMIIPSYWSIAMALLILMAEAFFIKKLFSLNFFLCFILSFIINLLSSVAGVLITSLSVHGKNILAYGNMKIGTYLGLIPGYILTVLLEGFLLFFIALLIRKKLRIIELIKTSVIMNFFSYLIILEGIFIADCITRGKIFMTY